MITLHVVSAILVLFMVNGLNMGNDIATAVYHAFVVLCYLSPVLGAMLSDGWLGKFRLSCFLYSSVQRQVRFIPLADERGVCR